MRVRSPFKLNYKSYDSLQPELIIREIWVRMLFNSSINMCHYTGNVRKDIGLIFIISFWIKARGNE